MSAIDPAKAEDDFWGKLRDFGVVVAAGTVMPRRRGCRLACSRRLEFERGSRPLKSTRSRSKVEHSHPLQ